MKNELNGEVWMKGAEIRWVTIFFTFVSDTENFVLNYLIYCKLMERF
jgi:hypothetical protein